MVKKGISRTFKAVDFRKVIRVFAGLRSVSGDDFIIKRSQVLLNYIMLLGICSRTVFFARNRRICKDMVLNIIPAGTKEVKPLPKQKKFIELTKDELNEMIKTDPEMGKTCMQMRESQRGCEVINAIHSPLPATSVDA